jgi:hypothetical protein
MTKPSKAQESRAKAAECEIRAAKTKDRELKEYYTYMARDWWDLARQIETLDAEMATLAALGKRRPVKREAEEDWVTRTG